MPDSEQDILPPTDLSTELGASLASVWARYVGARPSEAEIQLDGNVVRWILPGGTEELESGLDADGEARDPALTLTGYKRETSAAVSKVTHRRVSARISKLDKTTGGATETFILDAVRQKN